MNTKQYYVSYQYENKTERGVGCAAITGPPIQTADDVFKIAKALESYHDCEKLIILWWQELPGKEVNEAK